MIKNYKIQQRLGIGSYGTVYQVIDINTNKKYVIKQISLNDLSPEEISNVKLEAKILSSINSKYVVKYYDSFQENNNLDIVMEYCDGGDLGKYINSKKEKNEKISEDLIWLFFIKMTLGLAAIHKLKILHRDLKALNIFLSEKSEVKIGDLGVAKILNNSGSFAKTLVGTPYYLSPELCGDKPYNNKSDVWALGCILYELCTFKHAFTAKSQAGLILKILKENPEPIGNDYSSDLQNLIDKIFDKNMEKRPSCFEILTSDIIMNKAKNYGLLEEIEKIYPEYPGFNYIAINGNNTKKILIYNKNRQKENLQNNNLYINNNSKGFININSDSKSKNSIYINKNKKIYKKRYNSISTESKINNSSHKKEFPNNGQLNIKNKIFSNLTPSNNNIKISNTSNTSNKTKSISNKLFIKKFLNKSQDKDNNGRYTNTDRKNIILIKKNNFKNIIKSSKSSNKIFIDPNNNIGNPLLTKETSSKISNKSIEKKIIFKQNINTKLNGRNYIILNNNIIQNKIINNNEENLDNNIIQNKIINNNEKNKNRQDIKTEKFINKDNINETQSKDQNIKNNEKKQQINISSSIENFEKELKKYYKFSSDQNYIKDNNKINGIDISNKKNFNDNFTKLNTFDILNGEEEFNDKKINNIMEFVKDLNLYIPHHKFKK